jgi:phage tail protein X
MGTFEKLGILVIVVIIVMILAVAIYQWGGAAGPPATVVESPELTVTTRDYLDQVIGADREAPPNDAAGSQDAWPGGIPKRYRIQRDDKVWLLVVKTWGLKESFVNAIEKENPKVNFARLRPGQELLIPDPSAYVRASADNKPAPRRSSETRRYEVQTGDTLESIAYRYLGAKSRWADIVSLNPGLEPKRLFEGQEIHLPLK